MKSLVRLHRPVTLISSLFVILTTTNQLLQLAGALCPEAGAIRPCTCDDEGLQCLNLNNSGLARVFSAPAERQAISV